MPRKSCQQLTRCDAFFTVKGIDINFPIGVHPVPLNTVPPFTTPCTWSNLQNRVANRTIGYGTNVEPTIAVNPANPCNIVAAWQNDRVHSAGALEIGIAYSFDQGKTWNQTVVPLNQCIGGTSPNISDVWLSWSSDGKVAYLNVLTLNEAGNPAITSGIVVVRSLDGGQTWVDYNLVYAALGGADSPSPDKNSITAHPKIPTYAYTVWDVLPNGEGGESGHSDTYFSQTFDAGVTWTPPRLIYNPFLDPYIQANSNGISDDVQTIDNILLVLPKKKGGDLLTLFFRFYATQDATNEDYLFDSFPFPFTNQDYALIRSQDNGATWTQQATIIFDKSLYYLRLPGVQTGGYIYQDGIQVQGLGTQLRSGALTSIPSVNPKNGYLYAVTQLKAFRSDSLTQIGLSTSRDGGYTWSTPVRINRTPQDAPNPQAFTPCVAAMANGYVGVLYCDFRNPSNPPVNNPATDYEITMTDIWLAIYKEVSDPNGGNTGIGLQFVQEVRITQQSYVIEFGAFYLPNLIPLMTNGDYQTVVARDNKFYCVYIQSFNPPVGGFTPRTIVVPPSSSGLAVRVDNNRRSDPYVSVVEIPDGKCCQIDEEEPDLSLRPVPPLSLPQNTLRANVKAVVESEDKPLSKALRRF